MKLRIFDTPHDAGIYAASVAENVILGSERPVLGLATGSTPIPFYQALVNLCRCGLDMSHVTTINLDEYIGLRGTHEQSYHYFMNENLFSKVNIKEENIFLPDGTADDLEAECERYDNVIRRHPIDLQILGIGHNGHIGFNEPDDLLLSKTHVVQLRPETVQSNSRFFSDIESVPKQAITMGVQSILQAKQIVLMAFGREKADIIAKSVLGDVRTDVPASILQLHRDVIVVLDRESASCLVDEDGKVHRK